MFIKNLTVKIAEKETGLSVGDPSDEITVLFQRGKEGRENAKIHDYIIYDSPAMYPFRLVNVYAVTVGFEDGTLDGDEDGACVGFAVGQSVGDFEGVF